ncbi:hypothetical protein T492DRAFT_1061338 [Pavlovales sp. CCMP2436]|nr:hypothetical protein T492DRAFT_1061338 [Pavlovales sp. CCMP2436]
MDDEGLRAPPADERPSIRAKMNDLLHAVGESSGPRPASARADLDPSTPRGGGISAADPDAFGDSPPRVLAAIAAASRRDLRSMLPEAVSTRSLSFEVIQSSLGHAQGRLSALAERADPTSPLSAHRSSLHLHHASRASLGEARSPLRRTSSMGRLCSPPSRAELRAGSPQPWPPASGGDPLVPRSAAASAYGRVEEPEHSINTLMESCGSYLVVLRHQQDLLREERRVAAERERPPVPGWYGHRGKDFNAQLRRARSWVEPKPNDWWARGGE